MLCRLVQTFTVTLSDLLSGSHSQLDLQDVTLTALTVTK